jgi:membrane protein implicated in regulation of membrane protease activity
MQIVRSYARATFLRGFLLTLLWQLLFICTGLASFVLFSAGYQWSGFALIGLYLMLFVASWRRYVRKVKNSPETANLDLAAVRLRALKRLDLGRASRGTTAGSTN